jgi:hypothetical protein
MERKCEVCGKPASHGVRDLFKIYPPASSYFEFEPDGPMHLFCDEHVRESKTTDVVPSPLGALHR